MQWIQQLLVAAVAAAVPGHHLASRNDLDTLDVTLDGHRLKGAMPGHAVAVAVETHGLVLVHTGCLHQAGVEGIGRQRQSRGLVTPKTLADRLVAADDRSTALSQTALPQVSVEGSQVSNLGHRSRPLLLQHPNPCLGVGLFIALGGHAVERLEGVMAGQGGVAIVGLAVASGKDLGNDGSGVVPPDLVRNAAEEGEGLDQPMQDGLGAFGRQGQGEGVVGVGPGSNQHRDQLPARGEIDVDVAEVAFQSLAGIMGQGDEGLASLPPLPSNIAADRVVTAGVVVFLAQAAMDLSGGVALLAGGLFIGQEDGVDDRLEGSQDGSARGFGACVGTWLGLLENLADLASGVMEGARDLANAHAIAKGTPDLAVVVHRKHPCLRSLDPPGERIQ